ncbi:MAG TPA: hypothetical protein VFM25_10890 [Verrucomicrobiae bacterium]|nr:hypothetical protein [Verrucomicrobiae bacterium]
MKRFSFFPSLTTGARLFLLLFALGFPLALAGHYLHFFELRSWLALTPALVWKGQIWRLAAYAFLPSGFVDWAVSLFWLITLVLVLGRNFSTRGFWGYCLLAAIAGALPVVLAFPKMESSLTSCVAIIFALLVAWDRFYRRERLILLGIGEISVRQAAMLIALINVLVLLFCAGWFLTLSMLCGGLAGWIYLMLKNNRTMRRPAQAVDSERIARLEL